ncbi:AAA family ATPase [Nocardioides convexus]|uniref:AAA family ATPase n=1 Tax=Nocardioides convexus TaxID=2712224 RepID=UPI00241828DC|nr:AAA family ATPase [Nocardioides convexus]
MRPRSLIRLSFSSRQKDRVGRLSGGMQRRLAFAASLVTDPTVLLLDEPTTGLDPEQRANLRRLVQELPASASVFISSHVMEDVEKMTDQIVVLAEGQVLHHGPTRAFVEDHGGPEQSAESGIPQHGLARRPVIARFFAWLGRPPVVALQFLVLLAAASVAAAARGTEWTGSWKMALDWGTFSVALVGPVVAGMACAAYVRMTNAGVASATLTSSRPLRAWLQPAIAVWFLGSAAVVVTCFVTTSTAGIAGAHAFPSTYWVIVPAICLVAANVAVGVFVGSVGKRRWLVPVAAAVSFALGVLSATGAVPEVFRIGGVTGPLVGETFAVWPLVLEAVAALGTAVVLCWAANLPWARTSTAAQVVGLAVVLPAVVAVVALTVGDQERYEAVDGDLRLDCAGSAPQVCMATETSRGLDELAPRVDRQAALLESAGVSLPNRFVQLVPVRTAEYLESSDGIIDLPTEQLLAGDVNDGTATQALTMPRLCKQFMGNAGPPDAWFDVRRQIGRWLLQRDGSLTVKQTDADAGLAFSAGLRAAKVADHHLRPGSGTARSTRSSCPGEHLPDLLGHLASLGVAAQPAVRGPIGSLRSFCFLGRLCRCPRSSRRSS